MTLTLLARRRSRATRMTPSSGRAVFLGFALLGRFVAGGSIAPPSLE